MKGFLRIYVLFAVTAALLLLGAASARADDVYLVYSGKDKIRLAEISKMLPAQWQARNYNIDLLALADYSGKQKVAAKLTRADLIIFINKRAYKPFDSSFAASDEIVVLSEEDFAEEVEELINRVGAP